MIQALNKFLKRHAVSGYLAFCLSWMALTLMAFVGFAIYVFVRVLSGTLPLPPGITPTTLIAALAYVGLAICFISVAFSVFYVQRRCLD